MIQALNKIKTFLVGSKNISAAVKCIKILIDINTINNSLLVIKYYVDCVCTVECVEV